MSEKEISENFMSDHEEYEKRYKEQRAERGYSDEDAWNIFSWFMEVMTPALKQMRSDLHGYPDDIAGINRQKVVMAEEDPDTGDIIFTDDEEAADPAMDAWKATLDRMIFLLEEMNGDTCSYINRYDEEMEKASAEFHGKYGVFGEKLGELIETEEEKAEHKKNGTRRIYIYSDDPDHPEWKELHQKWAREELYIAMYRDKCREEFFQLFSRYFWDLWD